MVGGWASAVVKRSSPAEGHDHVALESARPTARSTAPCGGTKAVGGVCPHLGGILAWNPAEQTRDCPLHGSRFERDGRLLHGPATDDLTDRGRA